MNCVLINAWGLNILFSDSHKEIRIFDYTGFPGIYVFSPLIMNSNFAVNCDTSDDGEIGVKLFLVKDDLPLPLMKDENIVDVLVDSGQNIMIGGGGGGMSEHTPPVYYDSLIGTDLTSSQEGSFLSLTTMVTDSLGLDMGYSSEHVQGKKLNTHDLRSAKP